MLPSRAVALLSLPLLVTMTLLHSSNCRKVGKQQRQQQQSLWVLPRSTWVRHRTAWETGASLQTKGAPAGLNRLPPLRTLRLPTALLHMLRPDPSLKIKSLVVLHQRWSRLLKQGGVHSHHAGGKPLSGGPLQPLWLVK